MRTVWGTMIPTKPMRPLTATAAAVPRVAAATTVLRLADDEYYLVSATAQAVRDLHGGVAALVVDQDALVDGVGQLPNCGFQSLCGVKGRHHDDDAFSVDHLVPRTRSLYVNAWPGQ